MARPNNYNPASLLNVNKNPIKLKLNAMSYGKLLEALIEGPCTYKDLEAATGLHEWTIRGVIQVLTGQVGGVRKLVHVCGWDTDRRGLRTIKVYKFDPDKRDMPRPRKSVAERSKAYRERSKTRFISNALTGQGARDAHIPHELAGG